jgi:hypothetical protein
MGINLREAFLNLFEADRAQDITWQSKRHGGNPGSGVVNYQNGIRASE